MKDDELSAGLFSCNWCIICIRFHEQRLAINCIGDVASYPGLCQAFVVAW